MMPGPAPGTRCLTYLTQPDLCGNWCAVKVTQKCETFLFDSISQSLVFRIRQSNIFNGSLSQDVKRLAISAAPPKPHHLKKRQLEIVLIKEFRRGNVASRHTETPRCVRGGVRVSTFHPGQICLLR